MASGPREKVAAIIVAAGRGTRAGASDVPKQFRAVGGEVMLRRTLALFAGARELELVQTVIHADDDARYRTAANGFDLLPPVHGGATRQASVRAGLEALVAHAPDIVLIHDAARPFASAALVGRAIIAARQTGAAIPAIAVTDTIKRVDDSGHVGETLERGTLRAVQTPQAFAFQSPLKDARISPTTPRSSNGPG